MSAREQSIMVRKPIDAFGTGRTVEIFLVGSDGSVMPWDSVAGHYTTRHSMTAEHVEAVLAAARRQRPGLLAD